MRLGIPRPRSRGTRLAWEGPILGGSPGFPFVFLRDKKIPLFLKRSHQVAIRTRGGQTPQICSLAPGAIIIKNSVYIYSIYIVFL